MPLQSAYKAGHSTETALLRVHNDVLEHLHLNQNVALVLLDLSAAFDTVDHQILINRLRDVFGIAGPALDWFQSYLTSRTQRINIDGIKSTALPLDFGVPQGSVLGPKLFTLYTTPLAKIIKDHQLDFHLYADDTQLYAPITATSPDSSQLKIEQCISDVKVWMTRNKLQLNDDKTELILFRKKRSPPLLESISVNNNTIPRSETVKNLGFFFDEYLTMQIHVTKLCQSIHYHLRNINRIRGVLDVEITKLLVHALVTSRLDYCNSLFVGLPGSSLKRLQILQNKAARVVARSGKRDHITPILRSLHWLPVEQRIKYKVACIVFKCLNENGPEYLKCFLNRYSPSRTLRSSSADLLEQKKPTDRILDRAFSFSAPVIWNSLSHATRNSGTFDSFRRKLKSELFLSHFGS